MLFCKDGVGIAEIVGRGEDTCIEFRVGKGLVLIVVGGEEILIVCLSE